MAGLPKVEIWSFNAHLTDDPYGQSHTFIPHLEGYASEAALWADMKALEPCAEDCHCYE